MASLTPRHREALDAAVEFLSTDDDVDAVILKGPWARGVAHAESDVDLAVLTHADPHVVERSWEQSAQRERADALLGPLIRYSTIELEAFGADIEPSPRGWTSGPDDFELRIGNWIAYARTYPIAYDKWLEEQLRDLLGLPELADRLAEALAFHRVAYGRAIVEELLAEHAGKG